MSNTKPQPITLGHVHLKTRDLDRAIDFYTNTFGFTVSERVGDRYAFLTDGSLHHIIALQNVGANALESHPYAVGLYHIAFEVPNKGAFEEQYAALRRSDVEVSAVDHGISWAMYFLDPDGNGLEIYMDTRTEADGQMEWQGMSRPISYGEISDAIRLDRSCHVESLTSGR